MEGLQSASRRSNRIATAEIKLFNVAPYPYLSAWRKMRYNVVLVEIMVKGAGLVNDATKKNKQ
jgi:hypothetical protein